MVLFLILIVTSIVISAYVAKKVVEKRGAKAMGHTGFLLWQDYILNFLGSMLGWAAIIYLVFFREPSNLQGVDIFIILFAYVGVTGYIPHLIINGGLFKKL